MPIYEYMPDSGACTHCGGRFERLQSLSEAPFTHCPDCQQACHRVMSAASVVSGGAHLLGEKHVARKGFTQYRKVGKGQYEKTAGKGPDTIEG